MDLEELLSSDEEEVMIPTKKSYRPRINFEVPNEFQFKEKFRLKRGEVEYVMSTVGGYLLDSERNKSFSLTPIQQVLVSLHWLGNGGSYHGVADMHGISKATVCRTVRRFVDVIVDYLFKEIVKFPHNMADVATEFLRIGGFPATIGCVDGTLIPIDSPKTDEAQYVDRNGDHSLNVMMICGPDYSFYYVNARWPGSVHDSRVLRTSSISQKFESGWRPFQGAVILGDSGYPLKEWLMTPHRLNANDPAEDRYNRRHKSTRRIIECAYGILKERFPCLLHLRLDPIQSAKVVITCATLHNIASAEDFMGGMGGHEASDSTDASSNEPTLTGLGRWKELLNYFR